MILDNSEGPQFVPVSAISGLLAADPIAVAFLIGNIRVYRLGY